MNTVLQRASVASLVSAIEDNLVLHFTEFGSFPGADLHSGPDLVRLVTGVSHPVLNGVFRSRIPPDSVAAIVRETLHVFFSRRVPMRWIVGPSASPIDLREHLEACGVRYAREWVGMVADLDTIEEAGPPLVDLVIDEVGTSQTLEKWTQALCLGNGFPEPVARVFAGVFGAAARREDVRLRHYLASIDGEPLATCTLSLAAGVAGVYWVATVPKARRRGIATALVLAALRDARSTGYRFAVLHSTQMGQGVYRQIGFYDVCTLKIHVWQP